jgi:hypothetical protein
VYDLVQAPNLLRLKLRWLYKISPDANYEQKRNTDKN